jgi:hypothetical protein
MSDCNHEWTWSRGCGVKVCLICDEHQGLERCFCGWSKTWPGHGREELIEMGETIDEDDGPVGNGEREEASNDAWATRKGFTD